MISKTLEGVVNDPMCINTGNYGLRCNEIDFLRNISKKDLFAAIAGAYNYGFIRGKRAAEAGRSKKK